MKMSSGVNGIMRMKRNRIGPRSGNRGISTIIGIVIFFLIFMLAVSSTFVWTDSTSKYLQSAKAELEEERLRASENLMYVVSNDTHILLINPTSMLVVVNQIWDNEHHQVWNGSIIVPAFDQICMNLTNTTGHSYKIISARGNIFDQQYLAYASNTSQQSNVTYIGGGGWNISWFAYYNVSTPGIVTLGNSTHSSLDLSFDLGGSSTFGGLSYTRAGFNATTRVTALSNTIMAYVYLNDGISTALSVANLTISNGTYSVTDIFQQPSANATSCLKSYAVTQGGTYVLTLNYEIKQLTPTITHTISVQMINAELAGS
jgi:hypothetical protein